MTVSEIYTTAPTQGPEKVLESFALLNQLHIPYSRVEHEPAETMEACAAISDALGIRICKNLFLCNRQKTDFYLLTMPEDIFTSKLKYYPLNFIIFIKSLFNTVFYKFKLRAFHLRIMVHKPFRSQLCLFHYRYIII